MRHIDRRGLDRHGIEGRGPDRHGLDRRGLDRRLLDALRDCGRRRPGVASAAKALSLSGEHGALWLAAGLMGAAADRERRGAWLRGTALVAGAHLASMGVKRVVQRPRPEGPALVRTAGRHGFPSSHATSAAAAAVAFGALRPAARRLVPPVAAAMCLSRLVVGVHHPTDVAAGVLLGAATAALGSRRAATAALGSRRAATAALGSRRAATTAVGGRRRVFRPGAAGRG
ncbi:phosphatase PAP2 family protein [Streptomyces sp. NPDC047928]|uniref:phosphatase PAP2 family protein n=1 Tax=unclassified Streptomyces TaxID=2593676 RepID=UPI003714B291